MPAIDLLKRASALALCLLPHAALAQDPERGEEVFLSYCAACHGLEGRGDGQMAAILEILPADLTQLSANNGGVFPLFDVLRKIDGRDPVLAHGGVMPLYGDFFEGFDTALQTPGGQPILTSQPLADVAAWLERVQE
ncbi:c-type cytochrome [Actibacterium lipolyticum]|uniref:Cytochrome c n=1 Tax=Actibacterium lipolyticum TaxID=1524263 RepID=A0A238JQG6_9RHOB|nr:cytochrome c [Actibacterium lipolyticum]SMX32795.1 Cytochrome c [Actibacterium lipolyticum]